MRYRIRWGKRGKMRFLSHHDEALVIERSIRRAALPLAYTKGFSPHPKIAFGSGLPVGYRSDVELLDLELTEPLPADELAERFDAGLPEDMVAHAAVQLPPGVTSLGAVIHAADYHIVCPAPWLNEALSNFLALDTYLITKPYKGGERTDDLRAGVLDASLGGNDLYMRCAIKPRSVRPSDVLEVLKELAGGSGYPIEIERTALLTSEGEGFVALDENYKELKVAS
jgi:radical SAM-linked protein